MINYYYKKMKFEKIMIQKFKDQKIFFYKKYNRNSMKKMSS